jgi:hypothetical protein
MMFPPQPDIERGSSEPRTAGPNCRALAGSTMPDLVTETLLRRRPWAEVVLS